MPRTIDDVQKPLIMSKPLMTPTNMGNNAYSVPLMADMGRGTISGTSGGMPPQLPQPGDGNKPPVKPPAKSPNPQPKNLKLVPPPPPPGGDPPSDSSDLDSNSSTSNPKREEGKNTNVNELAWSEYASR